MEPSEKRVDLLVASYFLSYIPFAYLIRGAGGRHGEVAVLPVYSAACLVTVLVSGVLFRGKLPRWAHHLREWPAWAAGASSTGIMYGASVAYMNKAPPSVSALVMKIGTLLVAALLSRFRVPLLPMLLAFSAISITWLSKSGGFVFPLVATMAALLYVVGWTGKMLTAGGNKGDDGFAVAETFTTVSVAFLVGQVLWWSSGGSPGAWLDPLVWGAGFFSEVTGVLTTVIVLLPRSHGLCMSLSRGSSIAAATIAQALREPVGGWGWLAALLGACAAIAAGRVSAETFPPKGARRTPPPPGSVSAPEEGGRLSRGSRPGSARFAEAS